MAYEHDAVIRAQYQQLAAARAQAVADYENGRTCEDEFTTMDAADRILQADQKRMALDRIATSYVASAQQQRANRYGLSPDELDIAHGLASGDDRMSNDQREATYAANKEKLRVMRATGQYRDDQGTVRR
jgi:hypothetical protein